MAFPEPDESLQNDFWQLSKDSGILATMLFLISKERVAGIKERM